MGQIPAISDEELQRRYRRAKPVVRYARRVTRTADQLVRDDEGDPYYLKQVGLRDVAFTWDPEPTKPAENLEKLVDITTYHTYGYHGFFKPSIAEVLAQIPERYLGKTVAFETQYRGMDDNYHAATTRLYQREVRR